RGYSQEYLAMELGIDTATYGRIERGQTKLTVNRLLEISNVFDVEPFCFFIDEAREHLNGNLYKEISILKLITQEILETLKKQKL
ncbi:MAG: helix-turn-helix transcriptional regulator, partial [Bacteroidota bacterium]|nr:helix-turn-helix transcriptional regulator [Bacteroidota bacterium]